MKYLILVDYIVNVNDEYRVYVDNHFLDITNTMSETEAKEYGEQLYLEKAENNYDWQSYDYRIHLKKLN